MKFSILALVLLVHATAHADFQPATCPNSSLGETTEDCPWAGIARALSQSAQQNPAIDLAKELKEAAPELASQIEKDGKREELKDLWGESINFDELANGVIVDPAILKGLAKIFHTRWISDLVANAGMEHTYGYLFSTLKTAFGYKRARWVHGEIGRGFGLAAGTFSPLAHRSTGGSLFCNATYFFGQIAFRKNPAKLRILSQYALHHFSSVADAVRKFDYSSLKPIRLEETIASKNTVLRTDFVPFPVKPTDLSPSSDHYLLVYSVVVGGAVKLITGFPVSQTFVDQALNPENLGEQKPIVTRYNAHIDGVSSRTFQGTRRVVPENSPRNWPKK